MFEHRSFFVCIQESKGRLSSHGEGTLFMYCKSYIYWIIYVFSTSLSMYRNTYTRISHYCLLKSTHQKVGGEDGEIKHISIPLSPSHRKTGKKSPKPVYLIWKLLYTWRAVYGVWFCLFLSFFSKKCLTFYLWKRRFL